MSNLRPARLALWLGVIAIALCGTLCSYLVQVRVSDMAADARLTWWIIDAPKRSFWMWFGAVAQGVAVLAPIGMAALEALDAAAARDAAVQGEVQRQTEVNGILTPMAILLGQLSGLPGKGGTRRAELHGQARQTVVSGLANLMGGSSNVRACYFEMTGSAPHRRLGPIAHWGRADPSTRPFIEGTPAGDMALEAIDRQEARNWSMGQPGPPPPGWHVGKAYRTYISVPVFTPNKVHGMLTVDAPEPDTFNFPEDIETVSLLARLLAATLSS